MRIIMRAAVRVSSLALLLLLPPLPAKTYAQRRADPLAPTGPGTASGDRPDVIVNLEFVDAPVSMVFKVISDVTGWTIILSPEVSRSPPKINLFIKNQPPEQVLDRVSSLAGLVID